MSGSVFSTLSGVLTGKHPTTGLLCRETGEVFVPKSGNNPAHWTFGSKHPSGYLYVTINGKHFAVHRIICQTFHDNPLNLPTVDHISRDKLDNRPSNLRFASYKTQSDNRRVCEDSQTKYGVRECDNPLEYNKQFRAANPDFAEKCREGVRKWRKDNPEKVKQLLKDYYYKQKALGKRRRTCPDGKKRFLTDEEFKNLYGK